MKIAYVVLHYNAYDVTVKCIESIKRLNANAQIVIVDNNSPNNSGAELERQYSQASNIHVLLNKDNVGFAKGNNIGYKYAKFNLDAELIIDINNDVTIDQLDFEDMVEEIVESDSTIGVIAPKIINRLGKNQNPYRMGPMSNIKRARYVLTYIAYYIGLKSPLWKSTYKMLTRNNNAVTGSYEKKKYDIVPHGACVIFTPSYVEKSDVAFVPITYFYGEEDILYEYIKRMHLRTIYSPEIRIDHWEKASTSTVGDDERERVIFQTKNRIRSYFAGLMFAMKIYS